MTRGITNATSPRLGAAGILSDGQGRVLLVQRGKEPGLGLWAFPGGSVRYGENVRRAVAREFQEETSIVVRVGTLAHVAEIMTGDYHFVVLDYFVTADSANPRAGSDADAVRWVGVDDWPSLPLAHGMDECLSSVAVRERLGWVNA